MGRPIGGLPTVAVVALSFALAGCAGDSGTAPVTTGEPAAGTSTSSSGPSLRGNVTQHTTQVFAQEFQLQVTQALAAGFGYDDRECVVLDAAGDIQASSGSVNVTWSSPAPTNLEVEVFDDHTSLASASGPSPLHLDLDAFEMKGKGLTVRVEVPQHTGAAADQAVTVAVSVSYVGASLSGAAEPC